MKEQQIFPLKKKNKKKIKKQKQKTKNKQQILRCQ